MQRILIFGNSGSGKTTLAARLRDDHGLAHLYLDELAWLPTTPPERRPLAESGQAVSEFFDAFRERKRELTENVDSLPT